LEFVPQQFPRRPEKCLKGFPPDPVASGGVSSYRPFRATKGTDGGAFNTRRTTAEVLQKISEKGWSPNLHFEMASSLPSHFASNELAPGSLSDRSRKSRRTWCTGRPGARESIVTIEMPEASRRTGDAWFSLVTPNRSLCLYCRRKVPFIGFLAGWTRAGCSHKGRGAEMGMFNNGILSAIALPLK